MLLSAVSVLVVAQSSSEIPEGLMNNPVLYEPCHSSCDDRFEVANVALAHVFLRVLPFCPISIILSMLCTHLHVRRTNGRNLGTFQNAVLLQKSGIIGSKSTFTCFAR